MFILNKKSNCIFLASAYEGGWPVLSLDVSSSHQCTVSVLIVAESATESAGGAKIVNQLADQHANPH